MPSNVNFATVDGVVEADAFVSATASTGTTIIGFAVVQSERYKSREGQERERTSRFECKMFTKHPEVYVKFLKKGVPVLVVGSLLCDTWIGKDEKQRSTMRVKVDQVVPVNYQGSASTTTSTGSPGPTTTAATQTASTGDDGSF